MPAHPSASHPTDPPVPPAVGSDGDPPAGTDAAPAVPTGRIRGLSEDWLATILGLVLLLAAILGVIPAGLVP